MEIKTQVNPIFFDTSTISDHVIQQIDKKQ